MEMVNPAVEIILWDRVVAALLWDQKTSIGSFEYHPDFLRSNIQIAPLTMPLRAGVFRFPELSQSTFRGLPGLVSDSLPDRFGDALIDQWLSRQGRSKANFSPVERLCYIGIRGMGALEFRPVLHPSASSRSTPLDVAELVDLASTMLAKRESLRGRWTKADEERRHAIDQMLRVGTSAAGARAKAVIAWNPATNEIRSGQAKAQPGFEHWLLKFDGVEHNRDREANDPIGFGRIEYAYSRMAIAAGIEMSPCRLLEENGRAHFMTKRFDRKEHGEKRHMLSLCGIAHLDFNMAGAHSYEQAMQVIQTLGMGHTAIQEQYRRMIFNVLARNQDDHTRNIAFLMDKQGKWTLSPAFDITFAYNPDGAWTSTHQMTLNGKRDQFTLEDFEAVAKLFRIKGWKSIHEEVSDAIANWPTFYKQANANVKFAKQIGKTFRKELFF